MPPYTLHSATSSSEPLDSLEIFFNFQQTSEQLSIIQHLKLDISHHFKNFLNDHYVNQLDKLYHDISNNKESAYFKLSYFVKLILSSTLTYKTFNPTIQKYSQKQRSTDLIMDYIIKHIDDKLTLATLSQNLHLSSSYIYHCIKESFNCTPTFIINELKLKKAFKLLRNPNTSISEIALQLGYQNVYYFSSVFKKHFGMNPSAIRNNNYD